MVLLIKLTSMVIQYYFQLVTVMFKMREHGCLHYYILFCGE